ncbi:GL16574 [Drosophila persimilis]|uniref:GL16574 n=1 Tax=Drosophila persimilis TaxID=7234 RepID=B4GWM2_DROPE|nr:GL16574 [Drosophila persimilis]
MTASFCLLFKRYIQIERNLWRRVLFEAIVMVIIMILIQGNPIAHTKQLLFPRAKSDRDHVIVSHKLDDLDILSGMGDKKREKTKYLLAYAPKTEFTELVINAVADQLGMKGIQGYKNNAELQKHFDERTTLAGIIFHDSPPKEPPESLSISIRFPSEFRTIKPFLTEARLWLTRCSGAVREKQDNAKDTDTNQDLYIREGFLQLQHHVFLQWFQQLKIKYPHTYAEPQVEVFNIRLRAANSPCTMMTLVRMPAFLYNFLYLLPFLNIIRNIAGQLEDGVMVHQWHYGFSFCTQYCCLFLVLVLRLLLTTFCNTQVVILEEPTLKLTGSEAQTFWTIVNQEKESRAFVVATYSVGEAEHVADRVAIINLGVLEANGTPFFLRSKFTGTLDMIVTKKPHVPAEPITDFINQFLTRIQPENEIGDTLAYRIPISNRPRLQKLCLHLESDRNRLGIDYFRIVGTELSDTYMKLVKSFRLQKQIIPDVTQTFKYQVVSQKQLRRQRIRAMLYKKMIHTAPNVWPIIMIFTSFILIAIIAKLSVMLDVPEERSNVIEIGFGSGSEMKNIPDITACGYVDIQSLTKAHHYKRQGGGHMMSSFTADSFSCEKGSYRDNLKKMNELKSLGAIEQAGDQTMNGYITQDVFHSAAMMLNLLHNAILKLAYPDSKKHFTLVTNHPLPTQLSMKINLIDNKIAHMNAPLALGCILPLAVSVFIIPLVEEQVHQLRILQVIAGLGMPIYWGVNMFWDLFTYIIYSVIIVVIMAVMGIGGFGSYENFLILMLMGLYGFAALTHTYVLSFYVNASRIRGFLASLLLHGITGIVLYILFWDVANSNDIFYYGACLFPGFSLLDGVSNIYTQCLEESLCEDKCQKTPSCTMENMAEMVPNCHFHSYFTWSSPGIMPAIIYMLVSGLLGVLLIFWIELHRREKKYHSSRDLHDLRTATYPFDDADMADVKLKIAESDMTKCKQSVFLVDQVEAKVPITGSRVNTVSFALNKYMSMGIYGRRNSGKSHLIRQLVGIDGFAFGEIYVRGLDLKLDTDKIRTYMGYCPQHQGLLMELTPREHIRLLCMIRGVPDPKITEKMHDLCLMLNMTGWMHRKCSYLTAEKLRKLNVALALVAYNKILVLDEPTYGLPGTTRDEIWNILRYIWHCGKT